jgi:hypothetical protein
MACSFPCAFVKWQIETIRYTRSNDQWWVAQGGDFERQLPGGPETATQVSFGTQASYAPLDKLGVP